MDLKTILHAIDLVGDLTPAAMALYEGFIASTEGADQVNLGRRYAAARQRSDALHTAVQEAFGLS